jgi:hypothetical protein
MNINTIVCAPWGEQTLAAEQRSCKRCGTAVALSKENVRVVDASAWAVICIPCWQLDSEAVTLGGLVGGKIYQSMRAGFMAARAARDRN